MRVCRMVARSRSEQEGDFMSKAGILAVKFDASRITETVKADLRKNLEAIEGIGGSSFDQVYNAALSSISAGRDMSILYNCLQKMNIDGMTNERAAEIARLLSNKATALMDRERLNSIGIKQARWLYSGTPCDLKPTGEENRQNAAHKAANGKPFDVSKGMFLDGKWTWPGVEPGCKCVMKPVVSGFS